MDVWFLCIAVKSMELTTSLSSDAKMGHKNEIQSLNSDKIGPEGAVIQFSYMRFSYMRYYKIQSSVFKAQISNDIRLDCNQPSNMYINS